ncbi:MAG: hypothetical protein A2W90_02405 [Bacteroidetes bacterium GWF2_42_66]|nr:MAG: hypothetical protein A2W92_08480 [Bacteroidetes bacterium GWA2_42_15]OFY01202.1 MAG: hypothetical protein A2W89_15890 [Bacteroidetes bacterium GWE2_42_39]OFY42045.1 MAG: hypothetical protein A2W90_02405 [Bacteroidetes bacterium GWF2_42_66]HBL77752.1 hypothetical protein [Prolixibacteraceae bacterium]HCB62881.1 hypothetical protein [Bacteroidales bacterium]
MKTNYFLANPGKDKSSVFAVINHKGKPYKITTGVSVEVRYWNKRRVRETAEYPESEIINIQLSTFEIQMMELFNRCLIERRHPTPAEIKAAKSGDTNPTKTESFTDFFYKYFTNANYHWETYNKYNMAYKYMLKYQDAFNTRLTFDAVDVYFYDNFKRWILRRKYRPAKGEPEKYYSLNYIGSLVKCIKKVLRESGPESRNRLHENFSYRNREFKTDAEQSDTVYLSMAELLSIHAFTATPDNIKALSADTRLENLQRKADAMNTAKNKFLIGAFTALRVSDFNRLKEVNIQSGMIRIRPRKGRGKNEDIVIPIHPVVRQIIESGFAIDTPISEQKINKHIKEVCQLVGITAEVSTARTEGGHLVERTHPKYKLVSTHTARRSGATNMYKAGIPAISIMKITGHRTERSFMRYIRISQEENAQLLAAHPFFS